MIIPHLVALEGQRRAGRALPIDSPHLFFSILKHETFKLPWFSSKRPLNQSSRFLQVAGLALSGPRHTKKNKSRTLRRPSYFILTPHQHHHCLLPLTQPLPTTHHPSLAPTCGFLGFFVVFFFHHSSRVDLFWGIQGNQHFVETRNWPLYFLNTAKWKCTHSFVHKHSVTTPPELSGQQKGAGKVGERTSSDP